MEQQFGKRKPRYKYFQNPSKRNRWSTCPACERKMGQKKLPLVIGVGSGKKAVGIFCLNFTCRYCRYSDLLIAHEDKLVPHIERYLELMGVSGDPTDFIVLGTMDRADWKAGATTSHAIGKISDVTHDFRDYVAYETRYGWSIADERAVVE